MRIVKFYNGVNIVFAFWTFFSFLLFSFNFLLQFLLVSFNRMMYTIIRYYPIDIVCCMII